MRAYFICHTGVLTDVFFVSDCILSSHKYRGPSWLPVPSAHECLPSKGLCTWQFCTKLTIWIQALRWAEWIHTTVSAGTGTVLLRVTSEPRLPITWENKFKAHVQLRTLSFLKAPSWFATFPGCNPSLEGHGHQWPVWPRKEKQAKMKYICMYSFEAITWTE